MSNAPSPPLDRLERTIASRASNPNEKSYTSQLLTGGVEKIGAKITEEAGEVAEAASEPGQAGREHFLREVGDLVYHLMVLMRLRDCTLVDLEAELARRFGVSGLDEKAARKPKSSSKKSVGSPKKPTVKKPASRTQLKAKPKSKR
jgi:phosphoribosyl-ATP pyrophosphohydrolase